MFKNFPRTHAGRILGAFWEVLVMPLRGFREVSVMLSGGFWDAAAAAVVAATAAAMSAQAQA